MSINCNLQLLWLRGSSQQTQVPSMTRSNRRLKAMPQESIMPPSVEPLHKAIKSEVDFNHPPSSKFSNLKIWYIQDKGGEIGDTFPWKVMNEFPIQNEAFNLYLDMSPLRTDSALNCAGFCRFLSLKRSISMLWSTSHLASHHQNSGNF